MRAIWLVKQDPEAWSLMPQALARVRAFCRKYDSDDPLGENYTRAIEENFAIAAPAVLVRAIVESGAVVGHGLISIERWFERTFLTVVQYEISPEFHYPIAAIQADLKKIETWGRSRGCDGIQLLARTPALARAFSRFYGFDQHRVLMRKGFSPQPTETPAPA